MGVNINHVYSLVTIVRSIRCDEKYVYFVFTHVYSMFTFFGKKAQKNGFLGRFQGI